jgi:hypothetical protein
LKSISVVELRMKNSGNDASSRLINGTPKTFEIVDMIKTRFRNSRYVFSKSTVGFKCNTKITSRFSWKSSFDFVGVCYMWEMMWLVVQPSALLVAVVLLNASEV